MIIELPKKATKKQVAAALEKLQQNMKKKGKGNLARHFGKLKSKEDGLAFQKRVRSEWD